MPAGKLRLVGVVQLGDDALEVSLNHGPVKRSVFADQAVSECDPSLGAFADRRKPRLTFPERQRSQVDAVGN